MADIVFFREKWANYRKKWLSLHRKAMDLKYDNGRLRDIFPNTYVPSTPEQQAELLKWCQEWDERVEEFL